MPVSSIGSPSEPPASLPAEVAAPIADEVGRAGGAVDERQPVDERRRADRADHQVLEPRLERLLAAGLRRAQDVQRDRQQLDPEEHRDQVLRGDEHRHPEDAEQEQRVVLAVARTRAGRPTRHESSTAAIAAAANSMSSSSARSSIRSAPEMIEAGWWKRQIARPIVASERPDRQRRARPARGPQPGRSSPTIRITHAAGDERQQRRERRPVDVRPGLMVGGRR